MIVRLSDLRNDLGKERVERTLRKVNEIRVCRGRMKLSFSGGLERQEKLETGEMSSDRFSSIS